jgi:predicted TIM-barrel fold metal-dependent hydrolase
MRFSPMYYQGRDDWMTSPAHRAAWKKAADLGVVFNFFISTKQLPKLEVMIRAFPDVNVIIDHLSQINLKVEDPAPELAKLLALSRYPRVWVKVSELTSVSKSGKYPFADAYPWVKRVKEAFGPDRLLWGTGYPGAARAAYGRPTLKQELTLVRETIPFASAEDRDKILGQNAARLWKLAT